VCSRGEICLTRQAQRLWFVETTTEHIAVPGNICIAEEGSALALLLINQHPMKFK